MAAAPEPSSTLWVGGPLVVATLTVGLLTWPIAFNLGAYRVVLYDDIFRLLVASSILLVVVLINPAYPSPWNWVVAIALAAPLAWFVAAVALVGSTGEALDRPAFVVALSAILLVSVPVTLRLLVHLFTPELAEGRRMTLGVVAVVAAVAIIGFVFGRHNPRFMTCEDFTIAGAAEPDNCAKE